jgi:hypothetical protein
MAGGSFEGVGEYGELGNAERQNAKRPRSQEAKEGRFERYVTAPRD